MDHQLKTGKNILININYKLNNFFSLISVNFKTKYTFKTCKINNFTYCIGFNFTLLKCLVAMKTTVQIGRI